MQQQIIQTSIGRDEECSKLSPTGAANGQARRVKCPTQRHHQHGKVRLLVKSISEAVGSSLDRVTFFCDCVIMTLARGQHESSKQVNDLDCSIEPRSHTKIKVLQTRNRASIFRSLNQAKIPIHDGQRPLKSIPEIYLGDRAANVLESSEHGPCQGDSRNQTEASQEPNAEVYHLLEGATSFESISLNQYFNQ